MEAPKKRRKRAAPTLDMASICRIIEVSGRAGLSQLKLGDLELSFHPRYVRNDEPQDYLPLVSDYETPPNSAEMETDPSSMADRPVVARPSTSIPVDDLLLEEMRIDQLVLDSPEAFELEMINAHLRSN